MTRALCIVAHPDDETIWMGGTILQKKDWKWEIFSLCRKNDPDRMPKFMKVCKFYGVQGLIGDLDDEKLEPLPISKIINYIQNYLNNVHYDYVFTHGANGEYGHRRHKEIHKAVQKLFSHKVLNCTNICYFSYIPGTESAAHDSAIKIPIAKQDSDWFVSLTNEQHTTKLKIIRDLYGFSNNIFETLSCGKEEAFMHA